MDRSRTPPRSVWFSTPRRRAEARLRLFVFPFAGGGAGPFRSWPDALGEDIELWTAHLPGREARFREAPLTRLEPLVTALADEIEPYATGAFGFFGHSMGALTAFALTLELQRRGRPTPQHLVVSGHRAPHLPKRDEVLHRLPDEEFVQRIRNFDGTPEAVLKDPELLDLLLPVVRSDFTICETFTLTGRGLLTCPITAFGGDSDPDVSAEELDAWRRHTMAGFASHLFAGGHFYLLDARHDVAARVADLLR